MKPEMNHRLAFRSRTQAHSHFVFKTYPAISLLSNYPVSPHNTYHIVKWLAVTMETKYCSLT